SHRSHWSIQIRSKTYELHIPVMLGTVSLGSEEDFRLELVDRIAVAQHECDGAISLFGIETDANLVSCGRNRSPYRGGNPSISIRHAQDRRYTDLCETCDFRISLRCGGVRAHVRVGGQFADRAAMRSHGHVFRAQRVQISARSNSR